MGSVALLSRMEGIEGACKAAGEDFGGKKKSRWGGFSGEARGAISEGTGESGRPGEGRPAVAPHNRQNRVSPLPAGPIVNIGQQASCCYFVLVSETAGLLPNFSFLTRPRIDSGRQQQTSTCSGAGRERRARGKYGEAGGNACEGAASYYKAHPASHGLLQVTGCCRKNTCCLGHCMWLSTSKHSRSPRSDTLCGYHFSCYRGKAVTGQ